MEDRGGDNPIRRALMSMHDTIACKGTVTKSMLRKLLRAGVISQKQFDSLQKKKSTYVQIQELMKAIESKTEAFELFLEVLQTEKTNGWIVKKLREKVTNNKKPKAKKHETNSNNHTLENAETFGYLYNQTFPLVFGKDDDFSNPQNLGEESKKVHLRQFTKELSVCRDVLGVDGSTDLSLREVIMKCKEDEAAQIKEQKKRYNKALLKQIDDNYALQQEILRLKVTMESKEREKLDVIENEVHRRVKQRLLNFDQPISKKVDSARPHRYQNVFQQEVEHTTLDLYMNERQQSMMSNYSD